MWSSFATSTGAARAAMWPWRCAPWDSGPSIVVGHSMGAFVAAALAAQEPGLVSALVLVDGGYVPDVPAANSPEPGPHAALALRIANLRRTYPSRQAYREILAHSAPFSSRRMESLGGKPFWTMKWAATRRCKPKRRRRECAPIWARLSIATQSTSG